MITHSKNIPVSGRYDVVVCGGGPSGWIAAISASRMGCRTALIERLGFLGGTSTACLVVPISGYYHNGNRVVGGIPWEFIEELLKDNAALIELPKGHISVDVEYYKLIAGRMVHNAGIDLFSNSYISGLTKDDNKVTSVIIENKNGTEAIEGQIFIDATGDGDVCALAGVPMTVSEDAQPLSLCFELINCDISTPLLKDCIHHDGKTGHSVNMTINNFLKEKNEKNHGPNFCGPWFNTLVKGNRLAVNITRNSASGLDNRAFSEAEYQMREDMFSLVELLREKYPEFKNCVISNSGINAGVREGRHLIGEYLLTGDDILSGKTFYDSIARNAHPIDIHVPSAGDQIVQEMPCSGQIPYRSLVSRDFHNIIASGRMISADKIAHATIRVQGTVMAIGQAAGTAAALCAKSGCSVNSIDINHLRDCLKKADAVI